MRILVTGGNGYVGGELSRRLCDEHAVTVVDNLRYGDWRFDPATAPRLDLRQVDVRDHRALSELFAATRPQVVIHLAAIHFIPECEGNPSLAVSTNVDGTVNLLTVAPTGCRFVFASSGAVYAPSESAHREEDSPTGPADIYGLTKLQGEQYVRYLAEQRSLEAVIVRLFNVVGPGETNPHILPEIIAQLRAQRPTLQLGNTSPRRDFIHVEDAALGFAAAATSGSVRPGTAEVVNLSGGRQYSVSEMIETLSEIIGREIRVERDPRRLRKVDRPSLLADISRIRERFDWTPQRSFRNAVEDAWNSPELPRRLVERYASGTST